MTNVKRYIYTIIGLAGILIVVPACSEKQSDATGTSQTILEEAGKTREEVTKEAKERLTLLKDKLAALKLKAADLSDEAKGEYNKQLDEFNDLLGAIDKKLDDKIKTVADETEEEWAHFKLELENSLIHAEDNLEELSKEIENALSG